MNNNLRYCSDPEVNRSNLHNDAENDKYSSDPEVNRWNKLIYVENSEDVEDVT